MSQASLIIIGDEILSGRTEDKNLAYLAKWLGKLGINLSEVRVVLDDEEEIIEAVNSLRKKYDYVFTTGGIGPTHDDITSECVAAAFGRELVLNDEAVACLTQRSRELNEARLKMAHIPKGAELIDNPVSNAPGFRLDNVFVLAGIPSVAQAMFATFADSLETGETIISKSLETSL